MKIQYFKFQIPKEESRINYELLVIIVDKILLNSSASSKSGIENSFNSGFKSCNNLIQYFDSLASFLAILTLNKKSLSPTFHLLQYNWPQ